MSFRGRLMLVAAAIAVAAVAVIASELGFRWPAWMGLRGRTLWDLTELVVVPISLALIAYFLSNAQRAADHARAERDREVDRELAGQRDREAAFQAYLHEMTNLLLEKEPGDERVRAIARSRTLTLLRALDSTGKRNVMQFLREARMIDKGGQVVDMTGADLGSADLSGLDLSNTDLRGALLSGCSLRGASVREAILDDCELSGADLTESDLFRASLGRGEHGRQDHFRQSGLARSRLQSAVLRRAFHGGRRRPGEAESGEREVDLGFVFCVLARSALRLLDEVASRLSSRRRPRRQ